MKRLALLFALTLALSFTAFAQGPHKADLHEDAIAPTLKPSPELTELEKLKVDNQVLQQQIDDLTMQLALKTYTLANIDKEQLQPAHAKLVDDFCKAHAMESCTMDERTQKLVERPKPPTPAAPVPAASKPDESKDKNPKGK